MVAGRVDDSWQQRAACRGSQAEDFYPPPWAERRRERLDRERAAKAICATCPVRGPCLDYALSTREPHGIWGGHNELERKQLLERRAV